jgi:rhodanese-related sulfurtransferase
MLKFAKNKILKKIDALELKQKINANENLFLLDIREDYEREISHIPSIHIPMGDVASKTNEIPKEKEIIIICRSGKRAEPIADYLQNVMSFPNVTILDGGLLVWKEQVDSSLEIE